MGDHLKISLNNLTPEQLEGIKQDYLYNTKLTVKLLCEKWNITSYTYSRLAGKWIDIFRAGLQKPCDHCGKPFITYCRKNFICSDCDRLRRHTPKEEYRKTKRSSTFAEKKFIPLVPVKVPPLELKRKYKFRDIDYDHRTAEDKVIKQGTLIQITDYFAVFDMGKYKAAVPKTDVLSVI